MIIEANKNSVTTVGDVKENAVRIDSHNIEHIVALLSTNLYSHPEKSFLRETISNAIDSTIEAGSNEPVILKFSKCSSDNNLYTVTIRDYGTGISPEKFNEIYLSIGASTKRESNEYLGCFGIGRFSCLACSNAATIKSFYNGIEYCYLMIKNGNKINIDLINQSVTEEHNGVEVSINTKNLYDFKESLKDLLYFPNLYIDVSGLDSYVNDTFIEEVSAFKNTKVLKYKNFYIGATISARGWSYSMFKVVLGNVVYNYDYSKVFIDNNEYNKYRDTFMYINPVFNIGDLDITPNREQLLYSDKTVKALQSKAKEVIKEIEQLYRDEYTEDFDNPFFYGYALDSKERLHLGEYSVPVEDCQFSTNITYNDTEWSNDFNYRLIYLLKCVPDFYHIIYNNTFCKNGRYAKNSITPMEVISNAKKNNAKINFYICKSADLSSVNFRRYLGTFDNGIILEYYSLKRTLKNVRYNCAVHSLEELQNQNNVVYELYKYIVNNCTFINKDEAFEKWCSENKQKRISSNNSVNKDKVYNITTYCMYSYGCRTDTFKFTFAELTSKKLIKNNWISSFEGSNTIFYTTKDSEELQMFTAVKVSRKTMKVVSISKELYTYIEKNGLDGWVNLNKIINSNTKQLQKVFTHYYYTHTDNYAMYMNGIKSNLLPYITEEDSVKIIDFLYPKHYGVWEANSTFTRWYNEFLSKGRFDAELTEGYNTLMKYVKVYKRLKNLMLLFGAGSIMLAWVAMKNHLLRLNYQTYSKVKSLYKLNNDECN